MRAAQTLLELGSFDARSPSVADRGIREDVPQSQDEEQDAVLTDSEMTLSIGEDGEWPQGDEDDIPIGEDGLPIGYVITRRNPVRAARPSKMKE